LWHRRKPAVTCAEIQRAISARFDREATGLGEDLIDGHVSGCHSCRYFESNVADLGRGLRVRSTITVPPTLVDRIRQVDRIPQGDAVYAARRRRALASRLRQIRWRSVEGWAAALPPAALAITLVGLGVGSGHPHLVPPLQHTRCNSYLITHHMWSGY